MKNHLVDVPGIKVGHAGNKQAKTGCTVVLTGKGATAGVEVRGAAPGTRETDLLNPTKTVEKIHAILLAGGSAFGLEAAGGVMQALEEKDIGFDTGAAQVPIVPGAVLFDLDIGRSDIRPGSQMGYQAAKSANKKETALGKVGAGLGCTVGSLMGAENSSPGGIGSASFKINEDIFLGALVAVNAFGDVLNEQNKIIAGCQDENGNFINTTQTIQQKVPAALGKNTTLAVIATNASLNKAQAKKLAQVSHNGYAKYIDPVHTMFDGDTIFAISTGNKSINFNILLTKAPQVIGKAIIKGVLAAKH